MTLMQWRSWCSIWSWYLRPKEQKLWKLLSKVCNTSWHQLWQRLFLSLTNQSTKTGSQSDKLQTLIPSWRSTDTGSQSDKLKTLISSLTNYRHWFPVDELKTLISSWKSTNTGSQYNEHTCRDWFSLPISCRAVVISSTLRFNSTDFCCSFSVSSSLLRHLKYCT